MKPEKFMKLYERFGSIKAIGRHLNPEHPMIGYHQARKGYMNARNAGLIDPLRMGAKGRDNATVTDLSRVKALETVEAPLPTKGKITRYLFTSAQNDTPIFEAFWDNLHILAAHYKAELHVSRFTYIKAGLGARGDKSHFVTRKDVGIGKEGLQWDPKIAPYASDYRLEIAPDLLWCGEMNILPTAERPLTGLEVYSGIKSAIFPHVKFAMDSIPSGKDEPTKLIFTTGTVTKRNYIQKKAGLKAEFHHCYGALLVEVDANGNWFARQINADSEGTICDLRIMVKDGVLTDDNDVEAITWGDIHVAQIEPWVQSVCWGPYGMLEYLHPKYQFFHDVLDFRAKSHHEVKKPHKLFKRWLEGDTDVRKEAERTVKFMEAAYRSWALNVVVDSNHHHHLGRWLEEQNGIMDAKNAQFWTAMQAAVWQSLAAGAQHVNYFKLMVDNVRNSGSNADAFKILNQDESFVICRDKSGGIECGIHGHAGPDGTRGNPRAYARLGRKANIGHSHRAGIIDGIYSAGTCGRLDADWTEGPSSWSHSHIITYVTGKRAIVTMRNKKWRA